MILLGFLEELTSPGGRILTPKNALTDDRIEESKVVISQDRTIITNMVDVDDGNTISSEIDPLADFLPPHPTERCSDELQVNVLAFCAVRIRKNKTCSLCHCSCKKLQFVHAGYNRRGLSGLRDVYPS